MAQKLDETAVANSLAILFAILYVVCILIIWISLSFATNLGNLIFHGLELSSIMVLRGVLFSIGSLVIGTVLGWILGFGFSKIYNKLI